MATIKGVNQTLIDDGVGLSNQIAAGLIDGRVKCIHDYRTLVGTEGAGTVIEFGGNLPAGAKILAILVHASVAQASLTYLLGTTNDPNKFALTGETGLQTALKANVHPGLAYQVGVVSTDTQVILTTEVATATAGIVYCTIFYSKD